MTLKNEMEINRRILVIDDNKEIHKDFKKILLSETEVSGVEDLAGEILGKAPDRTEREDFTIDSAFQGEEGLAMVHKACQENRPYAMVFVDVRLPPGWNGIETIRRLWEVDSELQAVIITAFSDYSWEQISETIGGTDRLIILKKPFDSIEIRQLASTLTRKWNLTRERKAAINALKLHEKQLEIKVSERTKELSEANVKLMELDRMKSMFIASMSHELRTPLNSILGFTGVVLDELTGELNAKQKDHLTRAHNAGRHLLSMISDIIDISRIEAGRLTVSPEEFTLDSIVYETVENIKPEIAQKGLTLEVSVPAGVLMHTDRNRLFQCIINLLTNALKFTETGSIKVFADAMDNEVEISVSDTGIGISNEELPKVFDAFERIESRLKIKSGGVGLGLYLTKKLVKDALKGTIRAESKEGKGCTFIIRVPKDINQTDSIQTII